MELQLYSGINYGVLDVDNTKSQELERQYNNSSQREAIIVSVV